MLKTLYDEAMVDCYGLEEQKGSLFEYLSDEIEFPFEIQHLGIKFSVEKLGENYGLLKFVVAKNGVEYFVRNRDFSLYYYDNRCCQFGNYI